MKKPPKPRTLEPLATASDARLSSPSTSRNKGPLLEALRAELDGPARVLEIASGTGEHAVHFCTALPQLSWQPSDIAEDALKSIEAWREATGLAAIAAPLQLDVTADRWWTAVPGKVNFILCCNMVHISPWATTPGLMAGAGALLPVGGKLALYGPFSRAGVHTAASNEAFDQSLKSRDPAWGVRDRDDVAREAKGAGLRLIREVDMPANNLVLLFEKAAS
jgi:hypothetical protein